MYSPSISNLIKAFKKFPSVGERTAERFVFHLLKSGKKETTEMMLALRHLTENVKSCKVCWNFSDASPCPICRDPRRDQSTICVVADPQDLSVIEHTGDFRGVYHVLRGLVDATDAEGMQKIKIKELFGRISKPLLPPSHPPPRAFGLQRGGGIAPSPSQRRGQGEVSPVTPIKEIILALNPDMAGETTMLYLEKELKKINPRLTVSRLARGLPLGSDLKYADDITLGSAIKNRIKK